MTDHAFGMEYRLRALSPDLHRRFTDTVFALQHTLSKYRMLFPEYTDHSVLHSVSVINFCNLIAGDQIGLLNADELYILLVSCYCHDAGMGISRRDYEQLSRLIHFGNYFDTHSRQDMTAIVRDFHHEFSGLFIRKYAAMVDIPSEEHLRAIIQVVRGHRRTDLMDETEYPAAFPLPGGSTACLPYLSALIRLADEIDVTAARNPIMLYDIEALTDPIQIIENKKLRVIRSIETSEDAFTLVADPCGPELLAQIQAMIVKMQYTLDICRRAVRGRTPYRISQKRILLKDAAP